MQTPCYEGGGLCGDVCVLGHLGWEDLEEAQRETLLGRGLKSAKDSILSNNVTNVLIKYIY